MSESRRNFLLSALGAALVGCKKSPGDDTGSPEETLLDSATVTDAIDCPDALDGGTFLSILPFIGEPERPLETLTGDGLEGRYVVDLSTLAPDDLIVPNDRFFVRTREPVLIDLTDWVVTLDGLVLASLEVPVDELTALAVPQGEIHFECSGNTAYGGFGLQSAATFDGVAVEDVFSRVSVDPAATQVVISGFDNHAQAKGSEPGASWAFRVSDLENAGAFFATHMNGVPLPSDHGFPLRLVVPGWYGCTMAKWVDRITWVDDDYPATSQMLEFASRTHQDGTPERAIDYRPAVIDRAAMPIRVERWLDASGDTAYLILGITWGGRVVTDALRIHVNGDSGQPVDQCERPTDTRTWSLWSHVWRPENPGVATLTLTVDDPSIETQRLDTAYYARSVDLSG